MGEKINSQNMHLLKWAVTICLPVLFLVFVPISETFTPVMRTYMACTLFGILLFMFELFPGAIVGIIICMSYPIFNVCALKEALAPWSEPVVFICIAILLLMEEVQNTPILKRMSYWIISKTGGSYFGLLVGIVLIDIAINFVIPAGSNAYIMMAFALALIKALDLEYFNPMAVSILLITIFGLRESNDWIYGVQAIGTSVAYCQAAVPDLSVGFIDIILDNVIFIPIPFIVAFLYTKIFKPETPFKGGTEYFKTELKNMGPMSTDEKKVAAVLVLMLFYLFTSKWTGFNMNFGFIVAPLLLWLPGINIAKKENLRNVKIAPPILLATTMSIGTVGATIGVGDWVSGMATPYLTGSSPFLFTGMVWIIGVVSNIFLTPAALQAMFCGPLATIAVDLGYSAKVIAYTIYHCGNQVFFPYETNTILIYFSLGFMTMKQFFKGALSKMAVDLLFILCLAVPYWIFIGLF